MLRCTMASLIPLMSSQKYGPHRMALYQKHQRFFDDLIRHESYYILRELPVDILDLFFTPNTESLIQKQNKSGLWKIKDGERISFDVLSALQRVGKINNGVKDNSLKFKQALDENIRPKTDFYSLLIKKEFFKQLSNDDQASLQAMVKNTLANQSESGAWDETVIATVVNLNQLRLLDVPSDHPAIQNGVQFLFQNLQEPLPGDHGGRPYGFTAHYMISTADRKREFSSALQLKPEWIPRNVCFQHLAVIQNGVALKLLVDLGYEADERVEKALDNLFEIDSEWNGLCKSAIHKKYTEGKKSKGLTDSQIAHQATPGKGR